MIFISLITYLCVPCVGMVLYRGSRFMPRQVLGVLLSVAVMGFLLLLGYVLGLWN